MGVIVENPNPIDVRYDWLKQLEHEDVIALDILFKSAGYRVIEKILKVQRDALAKNYIKADVPISTAEEMYRRSLLIYGMYQGFDYLDTIQKKVFPPKKEEKK